MDWHKSNSSFDEEKWLIQGEHHKRKDTRAHNLMQSTYMFVNGKGVSKCDLTGLNAEYDAAHFLSLLGKNWTKTDLKRHCRLFAQETLREKSLGNSE